MKKLKYPKGLPDTYGITSWDKAKIEKEFTLKFPNQYYKLYLGALLNFEDYGEFLIR